MSEMQQTASIVSYGKTNTDLSISIMCYFMMISNHYLATTLPFEFFIEKSWNLVSTILIRIICWFLNPSQAYYNLLIFLSNKTKIGKQDKCLYSLTMLIIFLRLSTMININFGIPSPLFKTLSLIICCTMFGDSSW